MSDPMQGPMILAIDPGYDGFGFALFDLRRFVELRVRNLENALRALVEANTLEPEPKEPPSKRLRTIESQAAHLAWRWQPAGVFVEKPATHGDYARTGKKNRADVNKLFLGCGAILCGLQRGVDSCNGGATPIVEVSASRRPKVGDHGEPGRHDLLELTARAVGLELPTGPRGGKPEDTWDAIWIGLEVLNGRVFADLPADILDR